MLPLIMPIKTAVGIVSLLSSSHLMLRGTRVRRDNIKLEMKIHMDMTKNLFLPKDRETTLLQLKMEGGH